jgi:hypothetical protein
MKSRESAAGKKKKTVSQNDEVLANCREKAQKTKKCRCDLVFTILCGLSRRERRCSRKSKVAPI